MVIISLENGVKMGKALEATRLHEDGLGVINGLIREGRGKTKLTLDDDVVLRCADLTYEVPAGTVVSLFCYARGYRTDEPTDTKMTFFVSEHCQISVMNNGVVQVVDPHLSRTGSWDFLVGVSKKRPSRQRILHLGDPDF